MAIISADAVGYVFRTDCGREGWSYIGQSTRLDREHVRSYFGSGTNITEAISQHGTEVLTKRVLASARTSTELHYLEILHIAEARAEGAFLLNGDFGGPRPFPTMQRYLREELPEAMMAALRRDHEAFHRLIAENRPQVEAAIEAASSITADDFYDGYERDLRALMDLSRPCPSCGSPVGEVCRTNSRSLTKPHNPCVNHRARPRS